MPPYSILSHVAILVPSVEKSAEILAPFGFAIGPKEEWPSEGTLEIYVGSPGLTGRLLLMQPLRDGDYRRALEKRGPGLHHIALNVPDLKRFANSLSGSGWLLHPNSLHSYEKTKTIWLSRPGVPSLLEIQESKHSKDSATTPASNPESFISSVHLPEFQNSKILLETLETQSILTSNSSQVLLEIGTHLIAVDALIARTPKQMGRQVVIRPYEEKDSAEVARLSRQWGYPSEPEESHRRITRLSSQSTSELWVAVSPDRNESEGILGWVHLFVHSSLGTDEKLEVGGLVVDEAYRGQGIGRSLMQHAETWAQKRGFKKARLTSNVTRTKTHRFYESIGYTRTKTSYAFEKELP